MHFHEYALRRLVEELGLDLNSLRAMILKALGGNPDSAEAFNSPLSQFAEPNDLLDRLYSLKGLQQLIQNNTAAVQGVQNSQHTKITVGDLAEILLNGQAD